jgi:hypothetical protein
MYIRGKVSWLIILLLTAGLLLPGISKPFIGHHDWNGVFYGNIARNYLRLGWLTKLGQVTNFGVINQPKNFYTHYPPLLTWIMALSFKLFGLGDWQARLVPVLFTFGSIWLLNQLFIYFKFSLSVRLAGLAVMVTPMWRYFALMPSQEALIIFFSLLSVLSFLKNQQKIFYFSVIMNGLSGWSGYFLYPWLWLLDRRRQWLITAGLLLTAVFLLHLGHVYLLTGSVAGGGLFEALKLRLNLAGTEGFTWWKYLILERQRLAAFYTLSLLGVAVFSTLLWRDRLVVALLGWGLSYPLIFSNVVYIHDYFNIFFIPWLAVATAYFFNKIKYRWVFVTGLWLAVFFERLNFYQALAATKAQQQSMEIGKMINQAVPENETAYFLSDHIFNESQNLFISFYADRVVEYIDEPKLAPSGAKYVFNKQQRIN